MTITNLEKPVTRRVGKGMTVRIDARGVTIRRYRGRRPFFVTWEQIAGLREQQTIFAEQERADGRRRLGQLGIELTFEENEPEEGSDCDDNNRDTK